MPCTCGPEWSWPCYAYCSLPPPDWGSVLGPESGIFDEHLLLLRRSYRLLYTKFVLSGIHVCDPSVNTASHHHWHTISWGSASLSCNLLLPLDASLSMRRKCNKVTNSLKFSCKIVSLILTKHDQYMVTFMIHVWDRDVHPLFTRTALAS